MAEQKKLRIDTDKARQASRDATGLMRMEGRCFPNPDVKSTLDASVIRGSKGSFALDSNAASAVRALEDNLLGQVLRNLETANCDESVYVGGPGVAVMLSRAATARSELALLSAVDSLLTPWERTHLDSYEDEPDLACSLLCGHAGWLLAGVLHDLARGDRSRARSSARTYCQLADIALSEEHLDADEWLYGRAGYLHGLLYLQAVFGEDVVSQSLKIQLGTKILRRGSQCAERLGCNLPLMWTWHGKQYLGAAHGVAGIIFMILQIPELAKDPEWHSAIVGTLDGLVSLQTEKGNWPGKNGEKFDHLVHFCHGAPGMVWTFCAAYEVFSTDKYLEAAKSAGETVWQFGLLCKGGGLCHGIAGNGYAFLRLLRTTQDACWLLRANYFAQKLGDQDIMAQCREPDNPYSLFEGVAGTVCFLVELRSSSPHSALFPFFDVPKSV